MKLLISDFDGTYYTDEDNIIINNKYINEFRSEGNIFMLSSGRSFKSLKEMTERFNILYDYLSCCDGSILYDNKDNIVVHFDLNKDILNEFLKLKNIIKIERIQYSYHDDYYPKRKNGNLIGCNLVIKNEDITNSFINKWNKLKNKYLNYDFLAYKHDEITFFCLKNKGINKSSTVKYLEKSLNLNHQDIIVFGDNDNDLDMLKQYQSYYVGEVDHHIKDVCLRGFNQVYEWFKKISVNKH